MLTPIKTPRKIRNFLTYDLEWIPGTLEVRVVGVFDGDRYRCYKDISSFLDGELTSANRGKWFYAHAGGLADVQFVLEEVVRRINEVGGWQTYRVDAAFSGSSAIITKVKRGNNSWHFVDSFWLLRDKLSNIGKALGMEKGGIKEDEPAKSEAEFDEQQRKVREWYATVPIAELIEYNEQDCRILYRAINEFEDALLGFGGQLQMTIASCAMHLFRRKYLSESIDTNQSVNKRARHAYIASRVEVFDSNVTDGYYYDINSSFPFAMTQPCPGEFFGTGRYIPDTDKFLYIADCEVSVPEMTLPPLPYRSESGRIFFPTGKWRCFFSNVDVELLQQCGGRIEKVHECLLFHPFDDLAAYATDLYNHRKQAETAFEKIVYKFLLNSLYGKFAEKQDKQSLKINPSESDFARWRRVKDKTGEYPAEMLFPGAFLEERKVPVPHMHVPISMHITALARRTIFDFMAGCREVHYCDTDGFSTTDVLEVGNELGEVKLEKRIREGFFAAPKMYRLQGETLQHDGTWKETDLVKAKGFSRMNVARFAKVVEGKAVDYERMSRIKENFRRGFTKPTEVLIPKKINLEGRVPKRFTFPDGTTRPWAISEIEDL